MSIGMRRIRGLTRLTGRKSASLVLAAVLSASMVCGASCSESDSSSGRNKRSMSASSGEYNRGYREGLREAKQSIFSDHAGWMWLWMMEKEYADGYERGWDDGRRTVELAKQQKEADKRTEKESRENEY